MEEAYATAMRQPMQRPMSLEEARELAENPKWIEIRNEDEHCKSGWSLASCEYKHKFYYEKLAYTYLAISKYGKTWRCWRMRPTEEERAAAEWSE